VAAGYSTATFNVGVTEPKNAYAGGSYDIVVVKMDEDSNYLWHTFFGGSGTDVAWGVSVDGSGNVVVAGESTATFKMGGTAPKNAYAGGDDIVVVKMDGDGNYLWHTFFGSAEGSGTDVAWGVSVDGIGNVVVAGYSTATFDVGGTAPKNAYAGSDDIVVVKMDGSGNYLWHAFFGGTGLDVAFGVKVDGSGNVVVAGLSTASFNVDWTAPKNAYAGSQDIVAVKMDGNGNYLWHTFFGGVGPDVAFGVSVDVSGNVVVAGSSTATFNVGVTAPKNAHAGDADIVVVKIDTPPAIISATTTTANGSYNVLDTINITVNFSESVSSTGLTINLDSGGSVATGALNGVTSYSGVYTVAAGQTSPDLTITSITGTITDAASNDTVNPSVPAGQNIADSKAIVINIVFTLFLPLIVR
jgi:hypothetical protein